MTYEELRTYEMWCNEYLQNFELDGNTRDFVNAFKRTLKELDDVSQRLEGILAEGPNEDRGALHYAETYHPLYPRG